MRTFWLSCVLLWQSLIIVAEIRSESVCSRISNAISSQSALYWPYDLTYVSDILHWASSSQQLSQCSVEPGTAEDVVTVLEILSSTNTPFAIKGGGHASNPGFSSTSGVQISMTRFNEVVYDSSAETATVGAGLIWDDVYAALANYGVNVVGGRSSGVGVAGFTLGGGFSWKSNQFGLTVDTIVSFELVKPTGEIVNVTAQSDPDLFFGLKGGMNNFGIVTKFTFQTHPQGQVWGGLITYTADAIPAVTNATANFASTNTDPKASLIVAYNYALLAPGISLVLFYDGPTPLSGIFDDFLAIPYFTSNVETTDFGSVVAAASVNITYGMRGIFNSVSLREFTPTILKAVANESSYWGSKLSPLETGVLISYDVEPILPSAYTQSGSSSAWPPSSQREIGFLVLNIYYSWISDIFDEQFHEAARMSAQQMANVAVEEGQEVGSTYPNYAIYDTPNAQMYMENVERLTSLREIVDPNNVMNLAGGFRF